MKLLPLFLSALILISPTIAKADYALSLYGDIKYPADFRNFDYVNPDAPKGGTLRLSALGTFDSLNPYIIKGAPASGIDALTNPTLMVQSYDEPFTMYAYVAEDAVIAEDKSSVTFKLNPEAKWDDGTPLTADDIIWTFETLTTKGAPFYRAYYTNVKSVTKDTDGKITFHFNTTNNRELPLIIAQMPILPKHYWADKDFAQTTLTPPVAAGPYKITNVSPGRSIEFTRNPDWWGKDLPVNKGRYNFDKIVYNYYRDQNVALEAFFAGDFDFQQENVAKLWHTAYNVPQSKAATLSKKKSKTTARQGCKASFIISAALFLPTRKSAKHWPMHSTLNGKTNNSPLDPTNAPAPTSKIQNWQQQNSRLKES